MNDEVQRQVLTEILTANLTEQRRTRRWGIFFKTLSMLWLFMALLMVFGLTGKRGSDESNGPHTALVSLEGTIAAGGDVDGGRTLESLRAAFEDKNTKAVILRANSPGGSPVQAGIINDEIRRLRQKYPNIPLYAVIGDICASGCYYAAAAADQIYADKASIVGSIGVLMDGFGFTGVMEKFGIERRLMTAGSNKGFLDPFSPMKPEQRQKAQTMLNEIHEQFINEVKTGRGARLKDHPDLFTGMVWSGATAKGMGLVDELGSVDSVARDVVKVEDIVDFTSKPSWTDRVARQIGAAAADKVAAKLDMQLK